MDLAKAIAPECKIEITGIRPGEKLHETMLSRDEARHAVAADDKYVIFPEYPWWSTERWAEGKPLPDGFEYVSDQNNVWVTTEELLRMVGDK
jgi:UDP-N-acetylglucosamine 4,6-dehydratase